MKKHINIKLKITMLLLSGLTLVGCEKRSSTYVPQSRYTYNDIQECKEYLNETTEQEQNTIDTNGITAIQESTSDAYSELDGLLNIPATVPSLPATQNTDIYIADAPEVHIKEDQNSQTTEANGGQTQEQVPTQNQTTSPETVTPDPGTSSGADISETNIDSDATPTDATDTYVPTPETPPTEGDNPGSTEAPDPTPGGEDSPTDGGDDPGIVTEPEIPPEDEACKIVNLEVTGDLGFYIWGEAPNTSNIHLFVEYANGNKEEVTDYTIAMNYPELSPITESISPYNTIFYSGEQSISISPCVPGKYNAVIEYKDATIEVPYKLVNFYVYIDISTRLNCTHIKEHNGKPYTSGAIYFPGVENMYYCYSYQYIGDSYFIATGLKESYFLSGANLFEALGQSNTHTSSIVEIQGSNVTIPKSVGISSGEYSYRAPGYVQVYRRFDEP